MQGDEEGDYNKSSSEERHVQSKLVGHVAGEFYWGVGEVGLDNSVPS